MNETAISRLQGDYYCSVFTAERKFINQLKELAEQYPNDVEIQYINDDGSIGVRVPSNWFRFVKPPTKRNYTEEQRKAMGERMKRARGNKKQNEILNLSPEAQELYYNILTGKILEGE